MKIVSLKRKCPPRHATWRRNTSSTSEERKEQTDYDAWYKCSDTYNYARIFIRIISFCFWYDIHVSRVCPNPGPPTIFLMLRVRFHRPQGFQNTYGFLASMTILPFEIAFTVSSNELIPGLPTLQLWNFLARRKRFIFLHNAEAIWLPVVCPQN